MQRNVGEFVVARQADRRDGCRLCEDASGGSGKRLRCKRSTDHGRVRSFQPSSGGRRRWWCFGSIRDGWSGRGWHGPFGARGRSRGRREAARVRVGGSRARQRRERSNARSIGCGSWRCRRPSGSWRASATTSRTRARERRGEKTRRWAGLIVALVVFVFHSERRPGSFGQRRVRRPRPPHRRLQRALNAQRDAAIGWAALRGGTPDGRRTHGRRTSTRHPCPCPLRRHPAASRGCALVAGELIWSVPSPKNDPGRERKGGMECKPRSIVDAVIQRPVVLTTV